MKPAQDIKVKQNDARQAPVRNPWEILIMAQQQDRAANDQCQRDDHATPASEAGGGLRDPPTERTIGIGK